MVMTQAAVFDRAEQRLAWLAQRRQSRGQTVAGAETPASQSFRSIPFAVARAAPSVGTEFGATERESASIARLYSKPMSLFRLALGRNQ